MHPNQRVKGQALTLGIVSDGYTAPVVVFQVRQAETGFGVAEWGFALGSAFWGAGLFFASAPESQASFGSPASSSPRTFIMPAPTGCSAARTSS